MVYRSFIVGGLNCGKGFEDIDISSGKRRSQSISAWLEKWDACPTRKVTKVGRRAVALFAVVALRTHGATCLTLKTAAPTHDPYSKWPMHFWTAVVPLNRGKFAILLGSGNLTPLESGPDSVLNRQLETSPILLARNASETGEIQRIGLAGGETGIRTQVTR